MTKAWRAMLIFVVAAMAVAFLVLAVVITVSLTSMSVGAIRVYRWA